MRLFHLVATAQSLKMAKGWLLNLLLLAAVAALGGWVYWLQQRTSAPVATLAQLHADSLDTVIIEREKDRLVFNKQREQWRMTAPFKARANVYQIQQVMALPGQTSHGQYPIDQINPAEFGLSPPRATVILNQARFSFGDQNPLNFQRYVQVGKTLHLIDDTVFHSLTAPASDWIDRKLLPEGKITGLELPGWKILLTEQGTWQSQPQASPESLENLVDAWRNARAVQVSPMTDTPPADAKKIHIHLANRTLTLMLLQGEPDVTMLRPDQGLRYHFFGKPGQALLAPETHPENPG